MQPVWPQGIPPFAAEQEVGFDTRSSFTVAEGVKQERTADLPDLLSSSRFSRECCVVSGDICEGGEFNFSFKDCEVSKSSVVASLFRKEKIEFCLSADTATFSCEAEVWRSERFSV